MQLQLQLPKLLGVAQTFVRELSQAELEFELGLGVEHVERPDQTPEISYKLCLTHCPKPSCYRCFALANQLNLLRRCHLTSTSIWLQFKSPTALQLIASEISIFQLCAANSGFNWIYMGNKLIPTTRFTELVDLHKFSEEASKSFEVDFDFFADWLNQSQRELPWSAALRNYRA